MKFYTEEEVRALLEKMVRDNGIRGTARGLKISPGDVHRVVRGKNGAGKVVPEAMGFVLRYVRT